MAVDRMRRDEALAELLRSSTTAIERMDLLGEITLEVDGTVHPRELLVGLLDLSIDAELAAKWNPRPPRLT